jgi:SAM-dependent methyltransferase
VRPTRPSGAEREAGSFRDPESRVFYRDGQVYRALSAAGLADFQSLEASGLLTDPRLVPTQLVDDAAPVDVLVAGGGAGVLRHESIPFLSYPYEWTFSMLKDAALLQLDLLLDALEHDLVLKDASPYNVQFKGARPVFIDIGAFERLRPGELWTGYRQFCMLYLFPLLLQALKGVGFQPWLRGSVDGISAAEIRGLMSFRDRFRRGLPINVFLQARLAQRDVGGADAIKREAKRTGAERELIRANVRKMRKLVKRLVWRATPSEWVGYAGHNTYDESDARRKDAFVREAVASRPWRLAWDLGCNNGRHSRIAAEGAQHVVALDADAATVEVLYRELREEGNETILPLTMNLADPSPALGWRGRERKSLPERGRPDLVLALALVHHMAIGSNVPVREVVDWLASLGAALVVEFPTREDPMVRKLLARKREGLHLDYERGLFERYLNDAFDVRRTEQLAGGTRILYFAAPRRLT